MAIFINEWFPNPTGNDALGEFVELYNNSNASVSVNSWTLETSAKKPKKISGTVPADGYLVLYRKQTKLVLKNSDESIALYDVMGKLVDQSSFVGLSQEGKSFSRIDNPSIGRGEENIIQQFSWGTPTPGAANNVTAPEISMGQDLPLNTAINHGELGTGAFAGMMFGSAILLAGLILYSIKSNEDLSDIFFNRDSAAG